MAKPRPSPTGALPPGRVRLPFNTVDKGYYEEILSDGTELYYPFPVRFPQLVIVDDRRDLEFLLIRNRGGRDRYYVSVDAFNKIASMDFDSYFVMVAFAGDSMKRGTRVEIEDMVSGEKNVVSLYGLLSEPERSDRGWAFASYHAIALARGRFTAGTEYTFSLSNQSGKEITKARHTVRWSPSVLPVAIEFEPVASGGIQPAGPFRTRPELVVVTSRESAQEVIRQNPGVPGFKGEAQDAFLNTDYETHFVVVAFPSDYTVAAPFLYIKKTSQIGDLFQIKGLFTDPARSLPDVVHPYSIIRVVKDRLARGGTLTFSIIDHAGIERVRTVATVP